MRNQNKQVKGQLLDAISKELLAEIDVEIKLVEHQNALPEYQVFGFMEYKPELSEKSHILRFKNQIEGEVFISIDGLPHAKTRYKIFLQSNVWNNLEWYKSL